MKTAREVLADLGIDESHPGPFTFQELLDAAEAALELPETTPLPAGLRIVRTDSDEWQQAWQRYRELVELEAPSAEQEYEAQKLQDWLLDTGLSRYANR